ncbi:MAG: glutamate synthase subunit beta [Actinomyces sp.]|nr:glutamate synthase subunit beta [Actinomyces sp.]MCI1642015.1 glutamate synthase subunit beta [Actinomyces sp.]MCI1663025.1 glutamate synthase subunit beta [Actinomyces sp.]MCI1691911.1 glutamate synthase subunit beta [Actinomyces sp.]MCI1788716.1 glutamate synthase subunit beta [Actinomyces sp.]MCI1831100.1 glutamate synthase subunit beta [Actinomyces sp.]
MADPQGFLKIRERELPAHRPIPVRIRDFHEVFEGQDIGVVERQAGRCMDCGTPFCHAACPLGNLIPEWNTLAWRDDWRDAVERLHATNNFPDFTGRLCPAPCEAACVLAISQPAVTIKNVEHTAVDHAWDQGWITPQIPQRLTGLTVAVVGSGPAGLAAAQQLTRAGHTVAVFERADAAGGLLRYGIPEFKMEKAVLDRRLEQMRAEGTRFHVGVDVGSELTGEDLLERFDAVVLTTGSTVPRDLPIPGRDLAGIEQAVDYLTRSTRHVHGVDAADPSQWISAEGKDVVIIGGGDTGADCLGTAIRQGAASVTSLEIMPQPPNERSSADPWPTYPRLFRVASAHEEGGERLYAVSTVEFLGDGDGHVAQLRLVDVEMEGGRPTPVEGTERLIPAQLVLLAMGFTGVERQGLVEQLGLEVDGRGRIVRDERFTTSHPGVFAAGDAGRGQSLIVWAIAEGRSAAAAVDEYLRGRTELPAPIRPADAPYRP